MERLSVALLFGGQSHEHAVSCRSATTVFSALLTAGHSVLPLGISPEGDWYLWKGNRPIPPDWYTHSHLLKEVTFAPRGKCIVEENTYIPDVAFPVMHGDYCEDGRLQGFLDLWGISYIGCGVEASVLAMNKILTKQKAESLGIPILPYFPVTPSTSIDEVLHYLPFPLFVKPAHSGSSIGASIAKNEEELIQAFLSGFTIDDTLLVEPYVKAKEIEVAVCDTDTLIVSRPGEIISTASFYDYENKYGSHGAETLIPARLSLSLSEKVRAYAKEIFRALGCRHLSRVDFFLVDGKLYFNEINTMPGFTSISMYPALMEDAGIPLTDLVTRLCRAAL
jgi:D-alanine-D-alanine ligase